MVVRVEEEEEKEEEEEEEEEDWLPSPVHSSAGGAGGVSRVGGVDGRAAMTSSDEVIGGGGDGGASSAGGGVVGRPVGAATHFNRTLSTTSQCSFVAILAISIDDTRVESFSRLEQRAGNGAATLPAGGVSSIGGVAGRAVRGVVGRATTSWGSERDVVDSSVADAGSAGGGGSAGS